MADLMIPLRGRRGEVIAETVVSEVDASLADLRWYRLRNGYVVRTEIVSGRKLMVYMHRRILSLSPEVMVDHEDGDRLNNRRSNLRAADPSQNGQNRGANRGRALPRGVYPYRDRFKAQAKIDGISHHLGIFPTMDAADAVVRAWRAKHMPFSADAREQAR